MADTPNPAHIHEAKRQAEILVENCVDILPEGGLVKKILKALEEKRPLKIKLGADPTAPDLHFGHAVLLRKLRQFQELGHTVQLLIGDFTAAIGDPSGRNELRPPLSPEDIQKNAVTYLEQVWKILDEEKTELLYNSSWSDPLTMRDVLRLMSQVTVQQLIVREDFSKRLHNETPIYMHELLYPIMQGYDSVAMRCDIEMGGTDQTFNCLMGREMQKADGQPLQTVMTMPLLEGLDGSMKMSKSKNNYIGLNDAPNDMFGKIMSVPDELMGKYFTLLTDMTAADWKTLHPMDAKKLLGRTLVTFFHNANAAETAQQDFETRFSAREIPDELPEHNVAVENGEIGLLALMTHIGFTNSNGEARQLVSGGGVKIDGEAITDVRHTVKAAPQSFVLQAGKRRMARITLV